MTRLCAISRRSMLRAAGTLAAVCATPAWAQRVAVWPDRPVRLIVPYPAGGSTDVLFRILAERLQDKLGQPFVVENRPGASGNVGIDAVAKSSPDGYMIGGATVGHFSINQFLIAKMPYDAEKDLGRTLADLRTAERRRGRRPACAGQNAQRFHHMGEGAIEWHLDRQSRARHDATSLRSSVRGADRPQRRPCAIPWRGTNHSGDVGGGCDFRHRQPGFIHFSDRGRDNARPRGDLGAALANVAKCTDHGGSGGPGFHRDLVGSLRHADRNRAGDRRQTRDGAKRDRRRTADAEPIFGWRGASFFEHPDRGRGFRRQGNGYVARGGAPLRSDAAVTISAAGALRVLRRPGLDPPLTAAGRAAA